MTKAQFDRDLSLAELINSKSMSKMQAALDAMLGQHWQIADLEQRRIMGSSLLANALSMPLRLDIETVGQVLASDVPQAHLAAAAHWIELLLVAERRYRMVAELHLAAVHADFEALQKEHLALQASELKYREIATQL